MLKHWGLALCSYVECIQYFVYRIIYVRESFATKLMKLSLEKRVLYSYNFDVAYLE